jgi:DNA polymerase-1
MDVQSNEVVYLVDGSSYFYRAYHAIGDLSNSKGFPTNAILGFTKMILKLIADVEPQYIAVVFDAEGPNFRHKMYQDYKANRPPMPSDMVVQLPIIKEVMAGLGLEMIEKQGYEADDIIGTLARLAEDEGLKVTMITGDKDFRQLLTPNVRMWDTMKDRFTEHAKLKEELGFEPSKIVDVMALAGDVSDNIPGVPGIGEKTAVGLIREYGSLEGVLEHRPEIKKKKLRENILEAKSNALLAKKLVKIDRFVPLDEEVKDLKKSGIEAQRLTQIFRELEFKGLLDQFVSRREEQTDYTLILSREALMDALEKMRESAMVSLHVAATGPDPLNAEVIGIAFACQEQKACYLPLGHHYLGVSDQLPWSTCLPLLREVLEDERIAKVGENIKYQAEVLSTHRIELKGIYFDPMIASYVINPGLKQHSLDFLAPHYIDHKMLSLQDVLDNGKNARDFAQKDLAEAKSLACEAADISLRLMRFFQERLKRDTNEELFHDLEMRLVPVLMDMEMAGIKIDVAFFKDMSARFETKLKALEKEIYKEAGTEFNLNSPKQLGFILFEKLQLPVQKKTSKGGGYSTDVEVLKKLAGFSYRVPELLLKYRSIAKIKSTYLDALVRMVNPKTNRLHTSFNQTITATGRLSSSHPNLQNIPVRGEQGRKVRNGFVADPENYLVSADYSQVELRIMAHYSEDKAFLDAFYQDEDIHTRTASELMGVKPEDVTPEMRRIAKTINFGIIYGMGPQRLGKELGIGSKAAKVYLDAYFKRYQGVVEFRDRIIASAREKGYVTTLLNRKRYLTDIRHDNRLVRSEAERMAINTPIQGTAADLIKKAMINIHGRLKKERFLSKMVLQVHDELVFEVPRAELDGICPIIKEEMETVHPLHVPLRVDIKRGKNWGDMNELQKVSH